MNMKEQIELLIKLQEIETETGNVESILNNISKRFEAFDSDLRRVGQVVKDEEDLLGELKKKYRLYESDVQVNNLQIGKTQEKLKAVKTNREYQALLKEIEEVKTKSSQLEDEMIRCLELIEGSEDVIIKKRDEYLKVKEQGDSEKRIIERETGLNKKKLDQLDADRKNIYEKVTPELLKKFLLVKEQTKGVAVSPVIDAVCHGCHMNIPPQMYNELHRFDSLKFCPHCQRIIYWRES